MISNPPQAAWTVEIPSWAPPSLNRLLRLHWAKAGRLKKRVYHTVAVACFAARVPQAKGKRRVSLSVVVTGQTGIADPDNLWKVLLDACVACGALVDDSAQWCALGEVKVERGKTRSTCITLEDL